MREPTKKQWEVYEYLYDYYAENDQLPPMSKIADHFGFSSPNAAHTHMKHLEAKGFIEPNENGKWRFKR